MTWRTLCKSAQELSLRNTLSNGQCFSWCHLERTNEWVGVLGKRVLLLRQHEAGVTEYCCLRGDPCGVEPLLRDYFQLDVPLAPLVARWGQNDTRLATVAACLPGMRVLRQPPAECLFHLNWEQHRWG